MIKRYKRIFNEQRQELQEANVEIEKINRNDIKYLIKQNMMDEADEKAVGIYNGEKVLFINSSKIELRLAIKNAKIIDATPNITLLDLQRKEYPYPIYWIYS